jgi:putative copper export protein
MNMLLRSRSFYVALCIALVASLVAAPAALAENGAGLAGPVTDKTVTFFCFGVIAFFAALVILLSLLQGRLEKRKEERYQTLKRLS